jgi:hypothetical protein
VSLIAGIPDSANHPRVGRRKITGRTVRAFHHDILYFSALVVDGVADGLWHVAGEQDRRNSPSYHHDYLGFRLDAVLAMQ